MLQATWNGVEYRLDICRATKGAHTEIYWESCVLCARPRPWLSNMVFFAVFFRPLKQTNKQTGMWPQIQWWSLYFTCFPVQYSLLLDTEAYVDWDTDSVAKWTINKQRGTSF
jgi:hypothetical protein